MVTKTLPVGTVHSEIPSDLRAALMGNKQALAAWGTITPLARNEWICWVENAKLNETRKRRVERTASELAEGIRRPCCWIGCIHRTDKEVSPSVKWVLGKSQRKQPRRFLQHF